MATLHEWIADPAGSALLHQAVGTDEAGRPLGILGNQELIAIIGNFPISTLTAFPGLGLERSTVTDVLHRHAALPAP